MFVIVTVVLCKHSKKKNSQTKSRVGTIRLLVSVMGVMALFGLTWICGALIITGSSADVFQYLFVILNSLQGLFIFVFFCLLGKDARELWLRVICCRKEVLPQTSSAQSRNRIRTISTSQTQRTVQSNINIHTSSHATVTANPSVATLRNDNEDFSEAASQEQLSPELHDSDISQCTSPASNQGVEAVEIDFN